MEGGEEGAGEVGHEPAAAAGLEDDGLEDVEEQEEGEEEAEGGVEPQGADENKPEEQVDEKGADDGDEDPWGHGREYSGTGAGEGKRKVGGKKSPRRHAARRERRDLPPLCVARGGAKRQRPRSGAIAKLPFQATPFTITGHVFKQEWGSWTSKLMPQESSKTIPPEYATRCIRCSAWDSTVPT